MKITSIMSRAHGVLLKKASVTVGIDLDFYTTILFESEPEKLKVALDSMCESDCVIVYHTSEHIWDQIDPELKKIGKRIPIISLSNDPSNWIHSTVNTEIISTCQQYYTFSGEENFVNLINYIRKTVLNEDLRVIPPKKLPWEGIYHPDSDVTFASTEEYLNWYTSRQQTGCWVGVVFYRFYWALKNTPIEDAMIRSLEQSGLNVIPVFTYSLKDEGLGAKGIAESIDEFLVDNGIIRVDAIIKMLPDLLGNRKNLDESSRSSSSASVEQLKTYNVPVFQPVVSNYLSVEQWRKSPGLTLDTSYSVAFPEFDGGIEPIIIGGTDFQEGNGKNREVIPDRIEKVVRRVNQWIQLSKKPIPERKVSFILNNNPCANAEASIGGAAHLDSLESVARILKRMKEAGYNVIAPESGEELIKLMLEKKAISEFRWTTIEDIISKGGALMQMDTSTYLQYFHTLSEIVRNKMISTWGEPPGIGMVHDNKIIITGLPCGNATVHVQPKRGCYGSRCDGQVCKILHDPECPPTHQYLATYYWIQDIFSADVIINIGTHGNLEWLPGKGLGLSQDCYPDVSIGTIPFLYIYNADNPPEGTVAKRRSYAVLVDHMQTVLTGGGLYEGLEELDNLLGQYENTKTDPARSRILQDLIIEAISEANLGNDIHLTPDMPFSEIVSKTHESLSLIRNTHIPSGMHIFGNLPEGEKRLDIINSIIRFDTGDISPRRTIARILGFDLSNLLANQNRYSEEHGASYGSILEEIEKVTKEFIHDILTHSNNSFEDFFGSSLSYGDICELEIIRGRILDICRRIDESLEIEALLNGYNAGYIPAGPSGLITRGHEDVLPTGRNFYSLDPFKVPTKPAWKIGKKLVESILKKYEREEGGIPENIAFYWMAGDIMCADGEMYAQLLALLGVEPVWLSNGQVKSFSIIPLEKLGRPRIDITVRSSGILRDNFSNCYELVDEAVQAVADLNEPLEMNYIRKHALENQQKNGGTWREATYRIFAARPGTYLSGVELSVYASAWKEEVELADIFVAWNGFALGKNIQGIPAHERLASSLSTVSVSFNKVQSDEYDLLSCSAHFGAHGGLTAAARHYSKNEVKPYYGDTREPEQIDVRDLSDEIRRVVRTKLLNPKWIEGMKEHGYKGAGDIMKRIVRTFGWEAATQEVDDWIFDEIADTFVNDVEMRQFFENNNPYALEEIARRLLEAEQRGLWTADEQVLEELKNNYLQVESWMEDQVGEGDFQGGNIDIITSDDVAVWGDSLKDIMDKVHEKYHVKSKKN